MGPTLRRGDLPFAEPALTKFRGTGPRERAPTVPQSPTQTYQCYPEVAKFGDVVLVLRLAGSRYRAPTVSGVGPGCRSARFGDAVRLSPSFPLPPLGGTLPSR